MGGSPIQNTMKNNFRTNSFRHEIEITPPPNQFVEMQNSGFPVSILTLRTHTIIPGTRVGWAPASSAKAPEFWKRHSNGRLTRPGQDQVGTPTLTLYSTARRTVWVQG